MPKLFEDKEILTEPSASDRLALGRTGVSGSWFWTFPKFKAWVVTLIESLQSDATQIYEATGFDSFTFTDAIPAGYVLTDVIIEPISATFDFGVYVILVGSSGLVSSFTFVTGKVEHWHSADSNVNSTNADVKSLSNMVSMYSYEKSDVTIQFSSSVPTFGYKIRVISRKIK